MMDLHFTWMIILPLAASPLAYLAGRIYRPLAWWVALMAVLAAWLPFGVALQATALQVTVEKVALAADSLTFLLVAVTLGLGTVVTLYSGAYMQGEVGEEKYYAMLLAMMGLMIGLGCARDLFNLWVWFEGMAVSSYLLVAFYREQPASLEAGMKYLVQSAIGSALVLMAVALVLAATGTVEMSAVQAVLAADRAPKSLLLAAGALFLVGYGVKVALVPLHTWLPDAHSQAPSGVSAMLSGVVIEAGLLAMLRSLGVLGQEASWGTLLAVFGGLNMLYGNLLALRQSQVKRLLAFSSLSHVGYMLFGLSLTLLSESAAGAQGAFFHLLTHSLMKGLAFLAAGAFLFGFYLQRGKHGSLLVQDLAGAAQKYPLAAFGFSVAALALGGLPPLAGFMSKWQIFVAAFGAGGWLAAGAMFMAFNSVLSLGYYAPLVNLLYRKTPSPLVKDAPPLPWRMNLAIGILTLAVIVVGFFPGALTWLSDPAGLVFAR